MSRPILVTVHRGSRREVRVGTWGILANGADSITVHQAKCSDETRCVELGCLTVTLEEDSR